MPVFPEKKIKNISPKVFLFERLDLSLYQQKTGTAPGYKTPKFFMDQLVEMVWQIAKQNPKGFTITLPDCQPVRSGYCIGHRDTQNSFGKKGLRKVIEHSLRTTKVVGGWKGYRGKYYFDTVMIETDCRTAIDLKHEHGQLAVYHIETGRIF